MCSRPTQTFNGETENLCPRYPWEFVQMVNWRSPIEFDEGWLLLTLGTGVVQNYRIGACLLDKKDPSKVLARTSRPLLKPAQDNRNGDVPNVLYRCGGLVRERNCSCLTASPMSATANVSDVLAME